VLRGQLDGLLALIDLPNVRIGVIPLGARMLYGRLLDRLWPVALSSAHARALLTRVAAGLAGDERAGQ
jgi:hypothetical protein